MAYEINAFMFTLILIEITIDVILGEVAELQSGGVWAMYHGARGCLPPDWQ